MRKNRPSPSPLGRARPTARAKPRGIGAPAPPQRLRQATRSASGAAGPATDQRRRHHPRRNSVRAPKPRAATAAATGQGEKEEVLSKGRRGSHDSAITRQQHLRSAARQAQDQATRSARICGTKATVIAWANGNIADGPASDDPDHKQRSQHYYPDAYQARYAAVPIRMMRHPDLLLHRRSVLLAKIRSARNWA